MDKISRRGFLGLSGLALTAANLQAAQRAASPTDGRLFAYVGRGTPGSFLGGPTGGGIDVFRVNPTDGSLEHVSSTGPEVQDLNSDGICVSEDGRFLYCVNASLGVGAVPGAGGAVAAFAINREDGSLKFLNTQPSMGLMPASVQVDRTNSRVVVSNHGGAFRVLLITNKDGVPVIERRTDDATVALFPVNPDGSLQPACDVAVLSQEPPEGFRSRGPERIQQPGFPRLNAAACHDAAFDRTGRWIIATDNGFDQLYVFPFDPTSRTLTGRAFPGAPGAAPRHIAVHPRAPYLFVTNEREATVSSFRFDSASGEARILQTIATVPEGQGIAAGPGGGANPSPSDIAIYPTARFLYSTNRGSGNTPDTVTILEIDEATGRLSRLDVVDTGGKGQRELNIDPSGKFLYLCNQQSNDVIVFAVDGTSGKIKPASKASVTAPKVIDFAML